MIETIHATADDAHQAKDEAQRDEAELGREQDRSGDGANEQPGEEEEGDVDRGHDGDGRRVPLDVLVGVPNLSVLVVVFVFVFFFFYNIGCSCMLCRSAYRWWRIVCIC